MSEAPFNPYHCWLGIPPSEQPADHYRLLGLERFEANADVIQHAADRQMAHVRGHQLGQYAALSQKLLNELSAARVCLLDLNKKAAYDTRLRSRSAPRAVAIPVSATATAETSGSLDPAPAVPLVRAHGDSRRTSRSRRRSAVSAAIPLVAACAVLGGVVWWLAADGTEPPAGRSVSLGTGEPAEPPPPPEPPRPSREAPPETGPTLVETRPNAPPDPPADTQPRAALPAEPEEPEKKVPDEPDPGELVHQPPAPAGREPVPPPDRQQEFRRVLDEIYNTATVRNREEKRELAAKLTALAEQAADPAERFVLLRRASEVASESGDARRMLELVARIADEFKVDRLTAQAAMLDGFAKGATTQEAIESLVISSASVVDELLDADRFDLAETLSAAVHRAAQTPAGHPFRADTLSRRQEVQALRKRWEQVLAARATLESDADDADAHAVVGRWYACVRDDWDRALPHFAQGSVAQLGALAARELDAPPEGPAAEIELADAWWEFGQSDESDAKAAWLHRAAYWYERAWPGLSSPLLQAKVRKRLEALGRPDPELAATDPETGSLGTFPSHPPQLSELLNRPEPADPEGEAPQTSEAPADTCPTCKGDGIVYNRCPNRHCARGTVRDYQYQVVGRNPVTGQRLTQRVPIRVPCPVCGGDYIKKAPCPDCDGTSER